MPQSGIPTAASADRLAGGAQTRPTGLKQLRSVLRRSNRRFVSEASPSAAGREGGREVREVGAVGHSIAVPVGVTGREVGEEGVLVVRVEIAVAVVIGIAEGGQCIFELQAGRRQADAPAAAPMGLE